MRRDVLWRSVARALGTGEEIRDVAFMWRRTARTIPYAAVAAVLCAAGGWVAGFRSGASLVAIGLAAIAVATSATTDYRVLAVTERGLVLMTGGRIRQVATGIVERLPDSTVVERIANNLVISDWRVGDRRFSVLRRFESTMSAIAATYPR